MTEEEKIAENHWRFIEGLLKKSGIVDDNGLLKYLYTTAMVHGIKHGQKKK